MSYTNYLDITQMDEFEIVGQWGSEYDNLTSTGVLTYNQDNISLNITQNVRDAGINRINIIVKELRYLYGQGVIKGISPDGDHYEFPIQVTLMGVFSSGSTMFGATLESLNFQILRVIVGKFINDKTVTDNVQVHLTNFTNWLHGNLSDKVLNLQKKGENEEYYSLRQIDGSEMVSNILETYEKKYVHYYFQIEKKHQSIQWVALKEAQLRSWMMTLANEKEDILKTTFDVDGTKVNFFQIGNLSKIDLHIYKSEAIYLMRDEDWKEMILESFKNWVDEYEKLKPVYAAIDIEENNKDLNSSIESLCVKFQYIVDNFYRDRIASEVPVEGNTNKGDYFYRVKVQYLLERFKNEYVQKTMQALKIVNIDELATVIKELRNIGSHGDLEGRSEDILKSEENKYIFKLVICALLRYWLLDYLGITSDAIMREVEMRDPFNVSVTIIK